MTLHYTLDANDYLQHQLFAASTSDSIKKQRRKTWLIFSVVLLVSGLAFYQSGNREAAYTALFFGLLCIFFFPVYQKWYYKRHFQKFITDAYKNRVGQPVNLNFTDDYVETSDITIESKILLSGIESITETGNYFYLKLKTGGHLIIPKRKLDAVDSIRDELKNLCKRLSIDFVNDLNWKWK